MSVDDINKAYPEHVSVPLSYSQQRLWLFQQLMPESIAYNTGGVLWLSGLSLTAEKIRAALNKAINAHSMTRSCIEEKEGKPFQSIKYDQLPIDIVDLSDDTNPRQAILNDAKSLTERCYRIEEEPLTRLRVYCYDDEKYAVSISAHHIITDAWSLQIFIRSFMKALCGKSVKKTRGTSYFDFTEQQLNSDFSEQVVQWKNLGLMPDEPSLIHTDTLNEQASYTSFAVEDSLSHQESESVQEAAKMYDTSKFELLATALLLTLGTYANHSKPVIAVPTLNRNSANRRNVGFYVNNAILSTDINQKLSVKEMVQQTRGTLKSSLKFEHVPIEALLDSAPLPKVAFNYRSHGDNLSIVSMDDQDNKIEANFEEFHHSETPFDLVLDVISSEHLSIRFVFAAEKFSQAQIASIINSYKYILNQLCTQPNLLMSELGSIPSDELQRIEQCSSVDQTWKSESFLSLVSKQAEIFPNNIALKHRDCSITYSEFEQVSNQVAQGLRSHSLPQETIIGVMMERGIDMLIAMTAIMKAGCAFLPLDPDYPEERIRFMLGDSQARLLITQQDLLQEASLLFENKCIAIDQLKEKTSTPLTSIAINLDSLAYLIYTSGSTGNPKGVAVSHRGLTMHVQTIGEQYGMTQDDIELHFASISFDGAVERWTVPLAFGSKLIIRDQELWTAEKTTQVLVDEKVTIACFPPSYVGPWLDWIEQTRPQLCLRSLTLGGEAFTKETYERIQRVVNPPRIINGYGPTETVVTPMIWRAYPEDKLISAYAPIGQAVGDRKLYILDSSLKKVPFGTIGELYVGMESGLARGYLNRPDLTAERFIPDPFQSNGERMYRTGDLVRFRVDGVVEYFGRVDQQVKIRGFRVELGESESRLQVLSKAEFCAVAAHDSPTGKRLVGYVQSLHSEQDLESIWREELANQLPDYMVPSRIIISSSLPLTPAGKVDRKQLSVPDWVDNQQSFQGLEGEVQHHLANAWGDLLNVEKIGADSHFFALGGDSITALQLVGRLRKHALILTPKDVFDHPVLSEMATRVVNSQIKPANQGNLTGLVPLLPIQRRFTEQYQFDLCNQYAKLTLDLPIDTDALSRAVESLVWHHDSLRLVFAEETATYLDTADFSFKVVQNSTFDKLIHEEIAPQQGRLVSVGVNSITGELLLSIHHLAVDALSWPILIEDLLSFYRQESGGSVYNVPAKTHNQKDWYTALETLEPSNREAEFWLAQKAKPIFSENRSKIRKNTLQIDKKSIEALCAATDRFARMDKESTLFALVALSLKKITCSDEVVIHRESHGRWSEPFELDLTRTVNWHTALFPLKVTLTPEIKEILGCVRDGFACVRDGGISYSAGIISKKWQYQSSIDVMFNFLGRAAQLEIEGLCIDEAGLWRDDSAVADAAIVVNVSERNSFFEFEFEFDQDAVSDAQTLDYISQVKSNVQIIQQYCSEQNAILTTADAPNTGLDLVRLVEISGSMDKLPSQILPLSALQQGLYFHSLLSQDSSTYVNQITLPIHGADIQGLESAWMTLMERHSILRSTVHHIDGQACLMVWKDLPINSCVLDSRDTKDFDLDIYKKEIVSKGFRLDQNFVSADIEPLWRLDLVVTGNDELACIFTIHHILLDGWSTGVLLSELLSCYQKQKLPTIQNDFSDYIDWIYQQEPKEAEQYWRAYLTNISSPSMLAEQYGTMNSNVGHVRYNIDFTSEILSNWQFKLKKSGLTLNTLIQGAWLLTLQRYTGQSHPIFGNTVAGRPTSLENSESMVGLFINTLPVTSRIDSRYNINDWLNAIQEQASAQREFSHISLSDVQMHSPLKGETLFDSLVVFENYPLDETLLSGTELVIGKPESYEFTHYPLTLAVLPSESLRIVFAYDSSKFQQSQIHALSSTTSHYLEELVQKLSQKIGDIEPLDKHQLNCLDSYVKVPEPWQAHNFVELFQTKARALRDREAIVAHPLASEGTQRIALTYQQIDNYSDALAADLIVRGIKRDHRVGVMFERGADMLVAMLGILKAGGAFLPLDPSYPKERLSYMIQDSDAQLVISDRHSLQLAKEIAKPNRVVAYSEIPLDQPLLNPPEILADQLAYVIYTSGSTGKPKGVSVSHISLSMHVQTIGQRYGMTPDDIELHFASISFDGAVERWTVPLAFGSKLVIRDQQLWSASETCEVLEREQITIACFPPSYVGPLLEWIEEEKPRLFVRSWTLGGEAFTRETYAKLQNVLSPKRIINGYGPTETVVTPMIWQAYADTPLDSAYAPIGTAVGQRSLYVLDANLNRVPSGVAGELFIGEEIGLARGYLDRPDLTAERFIPDPYSQKGQRMYRTGDLVRWREDGVMEYLGRADDQIKIRGFRVELGEIESSLQKISQSKLCAVKAFEGKQGKYLVGYLEGDEQQIRASELLSLMADTLPDYMVPSKLIVMDSLPLTPASKVDKKQLKAPQNERPQTVFSRPQGKIETILAEEWQALFDIKQVSRSDDFFALGGQSLLATQLVGRLQQKHQIRLSLKSVFDFPRLDVLAQQCTSTSEQEKTIQSVPRMEYMPASSAQKRLWFVQQLNPESSAYHMPLALRLKGDVKRQHIEVALQRFIDRHEVFRCSFCEIGGELMCSVQSELAVVLHQHRASCASDMDAQRLEWIGESFDLASPGLFRAYLTRIDENTYELLLIMHHIISDGISVQNMLRELSEQYQKLESSERLIDNRSLVNPLATKRVDYLDYANWQKEWLNSDAAEHSLNWWCNALKNDLEPLMLHSEFNREQSETFGRRFHFKWTNKQRVAVEEMARRSSTTASTVMLSLWHLLLHKYSGQEEIRIGIPVAARSRLETQDMQGCFINNLVIPANFDVNSTFIDLLNQVKVFTQQALEHQDLPFEVLVESLGITGNLRHHPLYQTGFNFQHIEKSIVDKWGSLNVEPFDPGVIAAQLELSLDIQAFNDGEWQGFINYAAPIFDEDFIRTVFKHYVKLFELIVNNPDTKISNMVLLDSDEINQIASFNATEKNLGSLLPPPVALQLQAQRTPDAVALIMNDQSMTYRDFDRKVNKLANWLRRQGVREETRVGLGLPRSFNLVIGLHAITRAGGAYIPLEPSLPEERLSYILQSSKVDIVLTDNQVMQQWPQNDGRNYVDLDSVDLANESEQAPKVTWQHDQAMYVIFTSGSTGLPKGVVNTQAALQNQLEWMQSEYAMDSTDCVLQKTPSSFDVSLWEFFWPLMYGAKLVIAEPEHHRQPQLLHQVICEKKVTTINFVPSMLHTFEAETDLTECQSLRRIICCGEALPSELANRVLNKVPHCELHNIYGPSEAAIGVTHWHCRLPVDKRVPIGSAMSNIQLHVLDDCWNPVPIGVPGELYLAGEGLAREYLTRPDLTAERFVPNPFVTGEGNKGARMYRTGDQVVRLADGRLEYLGRLDHQVKIRGLRIELGEIEHVLNQFHDVEESAVLALEQQTGTHLVAYIVSNEWGAEREIAIKSFLKEKLPDYMVPVFYVPLDKMPLSPNGKRDTKALPSPQLNVVEYRSPETNLERNFADIWQSVLGLQRVGLDDNFFALGGHSLLATRVIARAQEELNLMISLKDFFSADTLQALTDQLQPQYQVNDEQEQQELDEMAALMDELELL
ncbi:amino acid adenylation domain-containing protein [Vibrio caribbeanicus]|uniref:amino acid adenylation domain-containing protein n=1 Tax=Vibrio caribbeanicus TaxID=701175 RepID=UPI0030D79FF2